MRTEHAYSQLFDIAGSRQLAVMNDGLVIIHTLSQACSLRTDTFVTVGDFAIADSFSTDPYRLRLRRERRLY